MRNSKQKFACVWNWQCFDNCQSFLIRFKGLVDQFQHIEAIFFICPPNTHSHAMTSFFWHICPGFHLPKHHKNTIWLGLSELQFKNLFSDILPLYLWEFFGRDMHAMFSVVAFFYCFFREKCQSNAVRSFAWLNGWKKRASVIQMRAILCKTEWR